MKLRKLLTESEEKRMAKALEDILHSGFRSDIPKLWRASAREFDGNFEIFELKGNKYRDPKSGDLTAQILLDSIIDLENKDVPKRTESKFARQYKMESGSGVVFGSNVYLVFPDKKADIVSFDADTLHLRADVEDAIQNLYVLEHDEPHLFELKQLMDRNKDVNSSGSFEAGDVNNKRTVDEVYSYLKSNWNDIKKEFEEGKNDHSAPSIKRLVDSIDKYFNEMKSGVKEGADEVVFNGEKYLYVEPDFFDEWFLWSGSRWVFDENQ